MRLFLWFSNTVILYKTYLNDPVELDRLGCNFTPGMINRAVKMVLFEAVAEIIWSSHFQHRFLGAPKAYFLSYVLSAKFLVNPVLSWCTSKSTPLMSITPPSNSPVNVTLSDVRVQYLKKQFVKLCLHTINNQSYNFAYNAYNEGLLSFWRYFFAENSNFGFYAHCSKSSFFVQKIRLWFPVKIVDFLGEKLVIILWFWTF